MFISRIPFLRYMTIAAIAACVLPVRADEAKIFLTDGAVLRGDVALTRDEALLENLAGVVRWRRAEVARIEWLEAASTTDDEYLRRFWRAEPNDAAAHFVLAQWLVEQELTATAIEQCDYVLGLDPLHAGAGALKTSLVARDEPPPATNPASETQPAPELSPPPLLSERDIRRLKLSELSLDDPPEKLNVRLMRERGEGDLLELVREDLKNAGPYDREWDAILERGRIYEKLPIVVKATGLKYADRIDVRGSPRVFDAYRRQMAPLIRRGCLQSGCHGRQSTAAFRFPEGSQTSEAFFYTSFVLLDEMQIAAGSMIDRDNPAESVLIKYMLPPKEDQAHHPPVTPGRFRAVFLGPRDPRYIAAIRWIESLRKPHPDYELEYEFPEWHNGASGVNKDEDSHGDDITGQAPPGED